MGGRQGERWSKAGEAGDQVIRWAGEAGEAGESGEGEWTWCDLWWLSAGDWVSIYLEDPGSGTSTFRLVTVH